MRIYLPALTIACMIIAAPALADGIRMASSYQPVDFQPAGIIATDLTGNARDDVIVFATNPVRYQIFHTLDNGDIEPQEVVTLLGTNLTSFDKADLNNDGREDVLIYSNTHSVVHILLNNGDGQLTPAPESPMPSIFGSFVRAADMNQSGMNDIVVASGGSAVVHRNLGNATFSVPDFLLNFPTGIGSAQIFVIGDFNGDGRQDFGFQFGSSSRHVIIHSMPDGSWQTALNSNRSESEPVTILAADVTLDGVDNLVWVGSRGVGTGYFVFNPTSNTYEVRPPTGPGAVPFGRVTITGAVAATSRDGQRVDVFPSFTGEGIATVASAGDDKPGVFRTIIPPMGEFHDFRHVTTGDLNGDGYQDVVYAVNNPFGWIVFFRGDDDSFRQSASYTRTNFDPLGRLTSRLLRNDLPDGTVSYILSDESSSPWPYKRLTPVPDQTGYRLELEEITIPIGPPQSSGITATGDINGDGIADLLTIGEFFSAVLLGRADGSFEEPIVQSIGHSGPTNPVLTDLNGNGRSDLVILRSDGTAWIYLAQQDGSLSQPILTNLSLTPNPGSLAVADLDADGNPDLLCINRQTNGNGAIHVAYGRSDGTYEPPISIPTLNNAGGNDRGVRLLAADFNNNGLADIVVASSATIVVHYASSPRNYEPPLTVVGSQSSVIEWIQAHDINSDGRLDLMAVRNRFMEVFYTNPQGALAAQSRFYGAISPVGTEFIDLDQDGLPDLIYASGTGATILMNRSVEPCLPDLFTDGVLNLYDIAQFLTLFGANDPRADFTGDGLLNFFDFVSFVRLFNAGCP